MRYAFTLESIIEMIPLYSNPFIVQEELVSDEGGRRYLIFKDLNEYIRNLQFYNTCHEVLINKDSDSDIMGFFALDIDLPLMKDNSWYKDIEYAIAKVLYKQYNHIPPIVRYIWLTSGNSTKTSRHLLVQDIILTHWREQMHYIIPHLKSLLRTPLSDGIDDGIYRKSGSLRLPLNSKVKNGIKGVPLTFDEPNKYNFRDGLIQIRKDNIATISKSKIYSPSMYKQSFIETPYIKPIISSKIEFNSTLPNKSDINKVIDTWNTYTKGIDTGLEIGEIQDDVIFIKRVKSGKCLISSKVHDSIGGILFISNNPYTVKFHCFRKCMRNNKKCITISNNLKSKFNTV